METDLKLTSICLFSDTCENLAPADQCFEIVSVIPNGCSVYPDSCRRSCGQCTPCAVPAPKCILGRCFYVTHDITVCEIINFE